MLTPQDLRHFQKRLESERDAIAARMALRSRDSQETVREESGVGDSGDQATRLDDLDIEADEEAVEFLIAGGDMVIVAHHLNVADATYDAIRAAVISGRLPRARLDEAVAALQALRAA